MLILSLVAYVACDDPNDAPLWNNNWAGQTPQPGPEEPGPEDPEPEVKEAKARLVWIDAAANFKDYANSKENISKDMDYVHVHSPRQGDMYNWKSYSESSSDYICYSKDREITVVFEYVIKSYDISFHANGGSGAPDAMSKYYGVDITLPSEVPTRSGYTFAGWDYDFNSAVTSAITVLPPETKRHKKGGFKSGYAI